MQPTASEMTSRSYSEDNHSLKNRDTVLCLCVRAFVVHFIFQSPLKKMETIVFGGGEHIKEKDGNDSQMH